MDGAIGLVDMLSVLSSCTLCIYGVVCLVVLTWVAKAVVSWMRDNINQQRVLFVLVSIQTAASLCLYAVMFGLSLGVVCGVVTVWFIMHWLGVAGLVCMTLLLDGLVSVRDERV
jgi:hypothetical protein